MRLARAMRAGAPGTATEPDAVRWRGREPEPGVGLGRTRVTLLPPTSKAPSREAGLVVAAVVVADRDEGLVAGDDDALDRRAPHGHVETGVGRDEGRRPLDPGPVAVEVEGLRQDAAHVRLVGTVGHGPAYSPPTSSRIFSAVALPS